MTARGEAGGRSARTGEGRRTVELLRHLAFQLAWNDRFAAPADHENLLQASERLTEAAELLANMARDGRLDAVLLRKEE